MSDKSVRIERIQIVGVAEGHWPDVRAELLALAVTMRRVTNDLRQLWLCEHIRAGDHIAVRAWMEADTAWVKAPKKDRQPAKRVACPVKPWPKEIVKAVYSQLTKLHPGLNVRCVTLALNTEQKTIATAKASRSAYPRWMRILAGDGEFPSSVNPLPVLFDKSNGQLLFDEADKSWRFLLRVDRIPRDGKTATSTPRQFILKTGGRYLHKLRNCLLRIHAGEWEFRGSRLAYQQGKWYVLLCYQFPKPTVPELDKSQVAVLSPGRKRPIRLRLEGRTLWMRRHGNDVVHVRRQLLSQRRSRQENYKTASSSKRGHGRKVAYARMQKLSRRWRDFVKTWNGQLAREVVSVCVASGAGRLVYRQPEEAGRRFLACAGKSGGRRDSTGWDWFQLKTLLERRCEEAGVEFSTRKVGASPVPRGAYAISGGKDG